MITYFPVVYEDELVYSVLARFFEASGFLSHQGISRKYLKDTRVLDAEFFNPMSDELQEMFTRNMTIETLIMKHTMFPWYARFLSRERKNRAYTLLASMQKGYKLELGYNNKSQSLKLRYCPLCVERDREEHGECFFHCKHQLPGIRICPEHKCFLIDSRIGITNVQQLSYCTCERALDSMEVKYIHNENEEKFSEYCASVFESPLELDSVTNVRCIFENALKGTKYMSSKRGVKSCEKILGDYEKFYDTETSMDEVFISRLLRGEKWCPFEIISVGFMLGIDVKTWSNDNQTSMQQSQRPHFQDSEVLAKVQEYIRMCRNPELRPQKISMTGLCRVLGMYPYDFNYLPRCRELIKANEETYEEFFGRCITWGMDRISGSKKKLYWSDLRKVTSLKKEQAKRGLKYISFKYKSVVENMLAE